MLMKKPALPRIIGLLGLYTVAFIVLGMIQFARQGGFTRQVGNMQVSGRYKMGNQGAPADSGEIPIAGKLSVFFGGLEFYLDGESKGGVLSTGADEVKAAFPEYMVISGNTVIFRLSGGGELNFTSLSDGDYRRLRIEGNFPPDVEGFLLSYQPLGSSRIQNTEDGRPVIIANGQSYSFDRSVRVSEQGLLFLENNGDPISYQEAPERTRLNLEDYALSDALSREFYNAVIRSWRDSLYPLWTRLVQGQNNEDLVVAFLGEAVERGTYRNAKTLVSSAFLNGNRRSYGSSLYLGGTDRIYPALRNAERERLNRLSGLIDEGSLEILEEEHTFEYLAIRGSTGLLDRAAALVRDIDPAELDTELFPGIFEGFLDMKRYRPQGENPFGNLPEQVCPLVSQQLTRISGAWNSGQGLVLLSRDGIADIEFNLRLGKALADWAEDTGNSACAAIGRSLILSVLVLANEEGSVPARFSLDEAAVREEGMDWLDSFRIYRFLQTGEYHPRIAGMGIDGVWLWTSSPSVSAVQENEMMDISVRFPVGETHYLMIWNIQPFNRMQLHGTNWRSDPRYESYDSSGWIYYSQDRLLVVKLKHQAQTEHIRLYYSPVASASSPAAPSGTGREIPPSPAVPPETGQEIPVVAALRSSTGAAVPLSQENLQRRGL
jgi:hypothetical protein